MKLHQNTIALLRKGVCRAAITLPLLAMPSLMSAQTLLHRYSFVSDASDSVGNANGTLVTGNNGSMATIANGLQLPGSGGGYGTSGYLTLPAGILTNTASVTIEIWATQNSQNTWAELWDFSTVTAENFALIPYPANNGNKLEVALSPNNNNQETDSAYSVPNGSEEYFVFTFNTNNLVGSLYDDGNLVATHTYPNLSYTPGLIGGSAGTIHNFLGNDIWGDSQYSGTVYEFRIWNGAVSERYVGAAAIAGPSTIVTNLTPTSASMTAGPSVVVTGTEQAAVTVTMAASGSTPIVATSDATNWTTSNPKVLQVNSGGLIVGVAPGTATVSATVGGITATSAQITVTPQYLQNRYSFVSDATDSVSGANGTLVGPNGGNAASINNGLILPGNTHGGYGYSGYVNLPSGILTDTTSISVECWASQTQGNTWAELWDFGNNGNQNFALIPYPANNGTKIEVAFTPNGGEEDLQTSTTYPNGTDEYTVVTYNNYSLAADIYTNGYIDAVKVLSSTNYMPGGIGGAAGTDENNIGNDVYGDNQFAGTVYEFRIWNGAVSPDYVAAAAAAGPSVVITNTVPQSLTISLSTNGMIGSQTQQAQAIANLIQVSGVNLTPSATNWVSSNPTVLTVTSSGLITAVNGGSATVSATVNGVTATSATITVANTPPSFTALPSGGTYAVDDNVTLTATALGGGLSYQWSLGPTPLAGATNSTLVLTNLQLSQAGVYTLTVSNSRGSTNVTATLNVVQAKLLHRYSFVSDATDSVGGANGTVVTGNNGSTPTISDGLQLPGSGGGFGTSGYVSLPNGLLTNTTSLTIETWVTMNSQNLWATIWDFADNGNINFEFCPYSNRGGNLPIAAFTPNGGEDDLYQPTLYPVGTEQYTVLTVTASNLVASLYEGGTNVSSTTLPNSSYLPANIGGANGTTQDMLGNDTYGDPQFSGTIYEFRIWDGAVSPLYLSLSASAGPGVLVTNTTPLNIAVTVTNSELIPGESEPASAVANFAQVTGVPVTGDITNWSSSNPNVLTVSSSGLVTAVNAGTATISATMDGTVGTSAAITVPTSGPVNEMQTETNVTLLEGATFTVTATNAGSSPSVYYWYYNGGSTPISSLSGDGTLTIPNVQLGNSGTYTVVISNAYGTAPGAPVVLTVVAPTQYQKAVLALGPLGYWPLNETSGTIAYDVAHGYNGSYVGGCYLGQAGPTNGFFGGDSLSVLFDGSSGYVDIPEGPFNITNAITVMAWVNLAAENGFDDLFGHGDTSWRISINGSGEPGANDGAPPADATDPATIYDQNWHMVAYTYNGVVGEENNGVLYVDGVAQAFNTITPAPAGNKLDAWIGGAPDYPGARMLSGYVADAAIFTEALTAAQIQGIYDGTAVAGPVTISIAKSGSNVVLTWASGTLLEAPSLLGPWTTNSAAVSPYTNAATGSAQFFKVLVSP